LSDKIPEIDCFYRDAVTIGLVKAEEVESVSYNMTAIEAEASFWST